jgi:hypothetical protein
MNQLRRSIALDHFVLRMLFRKAWLAAIVFVLILSISGVAQADDPTSQAIQDVGFAVLVVVILQRVGVLTLVAMSYTLRLSMDTPMAFALDSWFFPATL